MNHVFLSPHLDDAVLSCGGAIHHHTAHGQAALVITIFAGGYQDGTPSAFARVQHGYWGSPPQPMTLRRAEDAAALALLGARVAHLNYLDAIYRTGANGEWLYPSEEALWGAVCSADPLAHDGAQAVASRLADLVPAKDDARLYAPLGVGQHVDHQLVHTAARRLLQMGYRVSFYEDYPYAERRGASESALVAAGGAGWSLEAIALSSEDVAAKVSALGYYRSQMFILFGGAEAMPNRIWRFAATRTPEERLAERAWRPPEEQSTLP